MAMKDYPNGPVAPSRQTGMMKGREGYPDASQMPEIDDTPVDPADAPPDMAGANPVIGALQTIQQFIAAMEKNQDPRAEGAKAGLMGIIKSVAGGEGAPAPEAKPEGEAPEMPEEKPEGEEEESREDETEDEMEKKGMRPMGGNPGNKGAMMRRMGMRSMNQGKESIPLI